MRIWLLGPGTISAQGFRKNQTRAAAPGCAARAGHAWCVLR